MPTAQEQLAEAVAPSPQERSYLDVARHYAGPHLSESVANLANLLAAGLEYLSPAGDVKGLMDSSRESWEAMKNRDALGALAGLGLGGASLAGAFIPGPPVRSAVKAADLPMDEASRMARAQEQGFDTSQTLYHATHEDFPAFDLKKAGSANDLGASRNAVFLTDNPALADTYLGGAFVNRATVPDSTDLGGGVGRYYAPGGQIMPVHVKGLDQFDVWDMDGAMWGHPTVNKAIAEARKEKAPGVVLENVYDPGGMAIGRGPKSSVVVVFNPKNIRSRSAKFDPKKAGSAELLASVLGAGLAAPYAASNYMQAEE